jgi:hypothetical protein
VRCPSLSRLFRRRLLYNILWKTLLFRLVAMLFRIVEELIPLVARHEGLGGALRHLVAGKTWLHFWVVQMWLFALLFLYVLAWESRVRSGRLASGRCRSPSGRTDRRCGPPCRIRTLQPASPQGVAEIRWRKGC